jgi:hypothetical protein
VATAALAADEGAIQAIQQAPDPSAAVAAFANGFAADRNNPKLYETYVARMVDLGLPELAYHQAEALTTLDANNGLAWGVVGYVNARRGEMPAAVSAIVVAGQTAPDNQFVQRTAGEILAWYDLKADKSQLTDNAKTGLETIRARFNASAAFTQAYETAKKAYASQVNAQQVPTVVAPNAFEGQAQPYSSVSSVYGEPSPVYYDNYYYDWGPGWVAPAPYWWWRPVGFFAGFSFCPFPTVFVFNDRHHHHDFHHHDHGSIHVHDRQSVHRDLNNQAVWHRNASGQATFFGTPARPNVANASRTMANAPRTTTVAGTQASSVATRPTSMPAARTAATAPTAPAQVAAPTMTRPAAPTVATPTAPAGMAAPRTAPAMTTPAITAPARTAPAMAAPVRTAPAAPAMTAPMRAAPAAATAPRVMAQPMAPTMARPAPSGGGMASASRGAFASPAAQPSGGGMRAGGGGGGHGGGGGRR